MFIQQLREHIETASKAQLPDLQKAVWRAYDRKELTEAEASALDARVRERVAYVPHPKPSKPKRRGARRATPASRKRSRRWIAPKALPPSLAEQFTPGETAVLSVLAWLIGIYNFCDWPIDKIAAYAGVKRTTVQNALREAERLGLIHIKANRVSRFRNLPNTITIISAEWKLWLRNRPKGTGFKQLNGTNTRDYYPAKSAAATPKQSQPEACMPSVSAALDRLRQARERANAQKLTNAAKTT